MSGRLVDLEGIDNCGKTTQARLVSSFLNEHKQPCTVTRELTTPIGKVIKWYFRQKHFPPVLKLLLFAGDRFIRQKRDVLPKLNKGNIVIADRWVLSAVVYRAVEGISSNCVLTVNRFALKPDFVIILDIPAESAVERGKLAKKPCPYSLDFLKKARAEYLRIAKAANVVVLDGTLLAEELTEKIIKEIK